MELVFDTFDADEFVTLSGLEEFVLFCFGENCVVLSFAVPGAVAFDLDVTLLFGSELVVSWGDETPKLIKKTMSATP
ncbi:hypothetical protein GI364_24810 (plasmid) [Alicyclobacillus sp. SO9]|nr:hypothetical protein GI364_24810 [Alicyclobacillus sp. SO9]